MAVRNIFKDDAECLYKKARRVEKFDERLFALIDDMADTMYEANGAGLAAPQVGILRRVFVMDCGGGLIEAINPEIVSTEGEEGDMEACLSFPERSGYVVRPLRVVMRAYDREGDLYEYELEGLAARCAMHETDHLDGHVYLEKVTEPPAEFLEEQRRLREAMKESEESGESLEDEDEDYNGGVISITRISEGKR